MDPIQAAIKEIESLEPGKSFSYRKIVEKYQCDRTTLLRRHQGATALRTIKAQNQQALYPY
jgi:hypothetical protein